MTRQPASPGALRGRRWGALGVTALVGAGLPHVGGHRGAHAARNLLVPGAGLYDERPLVGASLTALAAAATIAWVRWGVDWSVALVVVAAMALSAALAAPAHPGGGLRGPDHLAHEFPLVVLVLGALTWARTTTGRVPAVRRLRARRARRREPEGLLGLSPVDRCRAAALLALAGRGDAEVAAAVEAPDVRRRARRIGLAARGRRGGDPFRGEHAPARAALALCGRLDAAGRERLEADAAASWAGVPASEPGWLRPLDATLAALALGGSAGKRWADALRHPFGLRRGHRPAWAWAPLGLAAGRAPDWEHAAASALARAAGWLDHDDDWRALRRPALGAAARGVGDPADERMVAASRLWLALVDDEVAGRVLARPTVRHDPLARALDALAARLRDDAGALRPARPTPEGMPSA